MMPGMPFPPPGGRTLRNYADLDAPATGTFVPEYGLLLTPQEAIKAERGGRDSGRDRDRDGGRRRSRTRSRSRGHSRSRSVSPATKEQRGSRSRSRSRDRSPVAEKRKAAAPADVQMGSNDAAAPMDA